MDFNGLPLGLSMGLAMNADAMTKFGSMTEAEKEDMDEGEATVKMRKICRKGACF